jgi:hypothetical protein
MMGRNEECMHNFDEEPPGKFTLGKSRKRWERNMKANRKEVVYEC